MSTKTPYSSQTDELPGRSKGANGRITHTVDLARHTEIFAFRNRPANPRLGSHEWLRCIIAPSRSASGRAARRKVLSGRQDHIGPGDDPCLQKPQAAFEFGCHRYLGHRPGSKRRLPNTHLLKKPSNLLFELLRMRGEFVRTVANVICAPGGRLRLFLDQLHPRRNKGDVVGGSLDVPGNARRRCALFINRCRD